VIIFLFSYLGYRTKSKINNHPKTKLEESKTEIPLADDVVDLVKKPESIKQQEPVKQNPRFEVFTPSSDDKIKIGSEKSTPKNSHSPKTLIIKH
jgi:hypothetical protein